MRFTTPILRVERLSQHTPVSRPGRARESGTHPLDTLPKMVCLPSSQGVGASVMKNCRARVSSARHFGTKACSLHSACVHTCEPFVLGPAFAMDKMPAPVCLSSWRASDALGLAAFSVFGALAAATHPRNLVLELLAVYTLAAAPRARRVAPLRPQALA